MLLGGLKLKRSAVGAGVALGCSAEGDPAGRAPGGNAGKVELINLNEGESFGLRLWNDTSVSYKSVRLSKSIRLLTTKK